MVFADAISAWGTSADLLTNRSLLADDRSQLIKILHNTKINAPGDPLLIIRLSKPCAFIVIGKKAAFYDDCGHCRLSKHIIVFIGAGLQSAVCTRKLLKLLLDMFCKLTAVVRGVEVKNLCAMYAALRVRILVDAHKNIRMAGVGHYSARMHIALLR